MAAGGLMSTRLNLSGASVRPFQFPALKNAGASEPASAIVDRDPAMMGHAGPELVANGKGAHADEIAAEFAKAQAEGLQRGLEEGRDKGYAAGFAEGAAAAEASLAEVGGRLAGIIGRLGGPLAAVEQPVEEAIVALALEIARCVIGNEVKRSHEFLVRLVREAIAKVPLDMGSPRVLLNPADLELIRKLVPEAEAGHATLVADDTVEAGGCLVIADGESRASKDRRWNPRASEGVSQVNLTLSSRWRAVMLTLFDGEDG
jgi:flagellar assembly protein FliH